MAFVALDMFDAGQVALSSCSGVTKHESADWFSFKLKLLNLAVRELSLWRLNAGVDLICLILLT